MIVVVHDKSTAVNGEFGYDYDRDDDIIINPQKKTRQSVELGN